MADAPVLLSFGSLHRPGVVHGVSLALGGTSRGRIAGLNLGHTVGDDPQAVEANHALLHASLGVTPECVVSPHQVHGTHVERVGRAQGGTVVPATDGLISDEAGTVLLMRYADCVPVLLYDPVRPAIGLAHAGWRGTLARVAARTAAAMTDAFGTRPEDLLAAVGPAIGPCCYEVGPEVIAAARQAFPDTPGLVARERPSGHAHVDLWAAVVVQLREAGVRHIEVARLCTACRSDLFYSYRRQGSASGRFGAVIGLWAVGV